MAESTTSKAGFIAFVAMYLALLAGIVASQKTVVEFFISTVFRNYRLETGVIPGEWIVLTNDISSGFEYDRRNQHLKEIFEGIRSGEFYPGDSDLNELIGKRKLKEFVTENRQTLYFVNPYFSFLPMQLFSAGFLAFLFSMFLPAGSFGWIRGNLDREYKRYSILLRKQCAAHDIDFASLLDMPMLQREELIRNSTLPEVAIVEVEDYINIHRWIAGRSKNPLTPLKFYFRYRISAAYGNVIQGLVSGGAAILIFIIGLRGLKLIPPEEPSIILMALSIEFVLLIVLMITFAGSAQEERLDRVVKELESEQRDAIKQQTTVLHSALEQSGAARGGGGNGNTLADFEERRILDEILSLMLRKAAAEKQRNGN